jgi:O-acetyl-ADP-ribose deacetylase (regulator of RNase III)
MEYKTGDLLQENAEAFVNTVNCVGVMGRGIALQFKKMFPENFKAYSQACRKEQVQPGKMFVYKNEALVCPKYIINFPTKRHWKELSLIEDIENGLEDLVEVIKNLNISSIAIPPLGSGLGGLDWNMIRIKIEHSLQNLPNTKIIIFEPQKTSEKTIVAKHILPMTAGRASLIELMHRYLNGFLDPFITLLEIHKLMYFLQEYGEALSLKYNKASYGPYAENLRHVLNAMEGYYIFGYEDGGDNPEKQIQLVPGAYQDANKFLASHAQTKERLEKVANLIEGFESPFGLELLSTVHWVVKKENANSLDDILRKIYSWNERKKQFLRCQVEIAFKVLKERNLI